MGRGTPRASPKCVKKLNYLLLSFVAAACSKGAANQPPDPSTNAPPPPVVDLDKAKTVFTQRCVPCHGATGNGDGPASAQLTPKPRNYTDKVWQASVDDAYIEKIIKLGGAGVGKSPAMPNNPDLPPEVITGLKDVVRGFNQK